MNATDDKDILRRSPEPLREALIAAGTEFKSFKVCRCPFHDDRTPSAGIYEKDGVWRFKCQVCNVCEDVYGIRSRTTGRTMGDVLKEANPLPARTRPASAPKPARIFATVEELLASIGSYATVEADYRYTNPDTREVELIVVRCRDTDGKKTFLQASPAPGAGFVQKAAPKPWPIYNRGRIKAAESVVVVEGEKCVHALAEIGVVATTSPAGAGKAEYADWSPLAGKVVYLWADNDTTGIEHMRAVGKMLEKVTPAPKVWWLPVDQFNLPPKGDVVEFIAMYRNPGMDPADEVRGAFESAEPMGVAAGVHRMIEETISGKRRAVDWPWRAMNLSKALLPGTVTLVCGDPGSTKSFLLLEAMAHWHNAGIPVGLYELEEDRDYHLYRALAQAEEDGDLLDDEKVRDRPQWARAAWVKHEKFLDSFGARIKEAPDKPPTLDELAAWVEEQCAAGARIVAIDPVTAAMQSDKPWVDDFRFMMNVKSSVRRHQASLILITHPRKMSNKKGGPGNAMEDMAGGAAFSRFAQCVVWVTKNEPAVQERMEHNGLPFFAPVNRTIKIIKARNGRGAGLHFGFNMDKSLRFAEQGVIVRETKGWTPAPQVDVLAPNKPPAQYHQDLGDI